MTNLSLMKQQRKGHNFFWLPSYPCKQNPTEITRSKVKSYTVRNHTSFKLQEILSLLERAVQNIMTDGGNTVYNMQCKKIYCRSWMV